MRDTNIDTFDAPGMRVRRGAKHPPQWVRKGIPLHLALALLIGFGNLPIASAQVTEVPMTPEMRQRLTKAIRSHFACPEAKHAIFKGRDRHGTVLQVHCGPADKDYVAHDQIYRVTIAEDGRAYVRHWKR